MRVSNAELKCVTGHSFDIARQGYVNLLTNKTFIKNADTAVMIDARQHMHARPFFQDLARQISDICVEVSQSSPASTIVEPGGGSGFYANGVIGRVDAVRAVSFDISVHAAKVCAQQSERVAAVVADVWQKWPVADDSADVVLSVFSPRNFMETERVLKTGAVLIVVTPEEDHFVEIRTKFNALGIQNHKNEKIAASLENFTNIHQLVHKSTELLDGSDMFNSLISGPNGHHIATADTQMFTNIEPIHVTHCVNISVWKLV
jgi:23S rRNA (guanine745-N1)-methyltransferase